MPSLQRPPGPRPLPLLLLRLLPPLLQLRRLLLLPLQLRRLLLLPLQLRRLLLPLPRRLLLLLRPRLARPVAQSTLPCPRNPTSLTRPKPSWALPIPSTRPFTSAYSISGP